MYNLEKVILNESVRYDKNYEVSKEDENQTLALNNSCVLLVPAFSF